MEKRLVLIIALVLFVQVARGQTEGDYRSVQDGPWSNLSTWEIYDGDSWELAVYPNEPPNYTFGVITIQTGDTVDFNTVEVDELVIAGTLVVGPHQELNLRQQPNAIDVVTVEDGGILEIQQGGTMNFLANTIVRVKSGGKLVASGGLIIESNSNNLVFEDGSTYEHRFSSTGGTIPGASWGPSSTCVITSTSTSPPANLNQDFGHLELFFQGGGLISLGGQLTSISGNLSINSTKIIALSSSSSVTLDVGGNFSYLSPGLVFVNNNPGPSTNIINVQGSYTHVAGTLNLVSSANGATSFNVAQDFTWTGGIITKSSSQSAMGTLVFNGDSVQTFTRVQNSQLTGDIDIAVMSGSILDLGGSSIIGNGTLTVNSGATLRLGSTDKAGALQSRPSVNDNVTGNIRIPDANRNYSPGSTIVYNGDSLQYMGNGHPSNLDVTTIIDNENGVRLATGVTINGNVVLENGNLDISQHHVSLGGKLTPNQNGLMADGITHLTITADGTHDDYGLLKFSNGTDIGDLTISGNRNVSLGGNLMVSNNVNLDSGTLNLNGYALTLKGGLTQSQGTLASTPDARLVIADGGSGNLPDNLLINGGSIRSLTMNRIGKTLTTSSTLTIDSLNLIAGTFTHTGNVTMADNGTITVTNGELGNPVSAETFYHVQYDNTQGIDTGNELIAVDPGMLQNVALRGSSPVTLKSDVTVAGSLELTTGSTLKVDTNTITLGGDLVADGFLHFSDSSALGTMIFDGTTTLSGSVAPDFGHVVVSNILTIDNTQSINIEGDLTVNGTFAPGTGTVLFHGDSTQSIAGSSPVSLYRLSIAKTAGDVTIENQTNILSALSITTPTTLHAGDTLLTLVSNTQRTARVNPLPVGAEILGDVVVQRYLPIGTQGRYYRYVTPSVEDTFVSDWQAEVPITGTFDDPSEGPGINASVPSLFYYDETLTGSLNDRYLNYPSGQSAAAAPLVSGKGYALFVRSNTGITMDSRGELSQHEQVINVTAQSDGDDDGWNLIGNPYPSPIRWDNVTRSAGVADAFYIPDNSNISGSGPGFITYVSGVSVPETSYDGIIDVGQGFWVHATAAGTVTFNESDKVVDIDTAGRFYRTKPVGDLMRISLTGASGTDELAIRFMDDATDNFDRNYDALKLPAADLNFFALTNDNLGVTINTMGTLECNKSIRLSMNNVKTGYHGLKIKGLDSFDSDVNVLLTDNETGETIDLRKTEEYGFTITDSNINSLQGRFVLEVAKSRIIDNLMVSNISACADEKLSSLFVEETQPEVDYQINFQGHALSDWKRGNGGSLEFRIPIGKLDIGENILTVQASNGCTSRPLVNAPVVTRHPLPQIAEVAGSVICKTGTGILQAFGATEGQYYYWYRSFDEEDPVLIENDGKLRVESPEQTTAYYVSIVAETGCESERREVIAEVVQYADAEILVAGGNVLTSNYDQGNQWFFNNQPIAGATAPELKAINSGHYSLEVSIDRCTTTAQMDFIVTSAENHLSSLINIFPNPAINEIQVDFENSGIHVKGVVIMDNRGHEVARLTNSGSTGSLNIKHLSAGLYLLKMHTSQGTFILRLVKE